MLPRRAPPPIRRAIPMNGGETVIPKRPDPVWVRWIARYGRAIRLQGRPHFLRPGGTAPEGFVALGTPEEAAQLMAAEAGLTG